MSYAKACVQPAYSYFKSKFNNDLRPTLLTFKTARYFSPSKVHELRPTANDLDSLQGFPFCDQEIIDSLKSELPLYSPAAEDVSDQVDTVEWWRVHESDLPKWSSAFKLIVLHDLLPQNECFHCSQIVLQQSKSHRWKITSNFL